MENNTLCSKKVKESADRMLKTVTNTKCLKGRSSDAVHCACLYIACKENGNPKPFKEIIDEYKYNLSKKEVGLCYKLVVKVLDTSVDAATTDDYMSGFCSKLSLPDKLGTAARIIAKTAVDLDLVPGRSPISVSGAAIYMASQASAVKKTQKEIGLVVGAADVTIRQAYKLMYPRADELFPKDFEFVTPIDLLPLT